MSNGDDYVNLKDKLNNLSNRAGKMSYEELIRTLEDEATKGKSEIYIDSDDMLYEDAERLKIEGLEVMQIEEDDENSYDCYKISW